MPKDKPEGLSLTNSLLVRDTSEYHFGTSPHEQSESQPAVTSAGQKQCWQCHPYSQVPSRPSAGRYNTGTSTRSRISVQTARKLLLPTVSQSILCESEERVEENEPSKPRTRTWSEVVVCQRHLHQGELGFFLFFFDFCCISLVLCCFWQFGSTPPPFVAIWQPPDDAWPPGRPFLKSREQDHL